MTYREQIAKLQGENAALRQALEWIGQTTLRLMQTPGIEPEVAGCYCQIGRMAENALATDAGKKEAVVIEAAVHMIGLDNDGDHYEAHMAIKAAVTALLEAK